MPTTPQPAYTIVLAVHVLRCRDVFGVEPTPGAHQFYRLSVSEQCRCYTLRIGFKCYMYTLRFQIVPGNLNGGSAPRSIHFSNATTDDNFYGAVVIYGAPSKSGTFASGSHILIEDFVISISRST